MKKDVLLIAIPIISMAIAFSQFETDKANDFANQEELLHVSSNYPTIEMNVSGRDLVKLDIGSPSDPMVIMMIKHKDKWEEVDRTEIIKNNPNPQFVKSFKALYIFELHQDLRFEVYDADSDNLKLKKHDFIGYAETDVQALASNMDFEIVFNLKHDTKHNERGKLVIKPRQNQESKIHLFIDAKVRNLKKVQTFAKNNPFIEIARPSESGGLIPIYRTEVRKRCYSCEFKQFTFILQNLSDGNLDNPMIVNVYNYRPRKVPKLIGSCEGSINSFLESAGTFHTIYKEHKPCGEICFTQMDIREIPTFIDYLSCGLKISMVTSIDFTSSNGCDRFSLHHISSKPDKLNQYQTCISRVGSILRKYDSTQEYAVYGFGASFEQTVKNRDELNRMCFPLTFDPEHETVQGIQGIMDVYQSAMTQINYDGPTYFAPTIEKVTASAIEKFAKDFTYTILMIITDGQILDMNQTIGAIIEASNAPISIIIVGVGSDDFDSMEVLDADAKPLISNGERMKRDIVQFVPLRKFTYTTTSTLEQEVLAEVPTQVYQYCTQHNIRIDLEHHTLTKINQ